MSKHLTEQEWDVARGLYSLGKSYSEIGRILGCSRTTIGTGLNNGKKEPQLKKLESPKNTRVERSLNDRVIEALGEMRKNGKKTFTVQDLKKALLDVSRESIGHYVTGRHGDVISRVPFRYAGKTTNGQYLYVFTEGQTTLPRIVDLPCHPPTVFDGRTDHDILMDLKERVLKLETKNMVKMMKGEVGA